MYLSIDTIKVILFIFAHFMITLETFSVVWNRGALAQEVAVGEGKHLTLFGIHSEQRDKTYGQSKLFRFWNFQKFMDRKWAWSTLWERPGDLPDVPPKYGPRTSSCSEVIDFTVNHRFGTSRRLSQPLSTLKVRGGDQCLLGDSITEVK